MDVAALLAPISGTLGKRQVRGDLTRRWHAAIPGAPVARVYAEVVRLLLTIAPKAFDDGIFADGSTHAAM